MEMEKFYVAPEVEVLWLRKWKFWRWLWKKDSKAAWATVTSRVQKASLSKEVCRRRILLI